MRFKDKVVWITGGGSGIGLSLAKKFAEEGAKIAVSGRRSEKLDQAVDELKSLGADALAVTCDVTIEDEVADTVRTVVDHFGQLDVAVANAGFSVSGRVEDLGAEEWRRQFDVNVVGAATTARYAIPELRKTKGRLALTGSVAGTIATPGVGAYHSSKYAVRALGQVLAMELHDDGISCTTLQPGFVESEIARVNNAGEFQDDWVDKRPKNLMWTSEDAARVMVDAIYKRKREFTFSAHGKAGAFLGKHMPGLVHHVVTKFMGQPYERN